jgi:hypothetical protein
MVYCILNRINLITKNTSLGFLPINTFIFFLFLLTDILVHLIIYFDSVILVTYVLSEKVLS